jgi:flagellar motility protein MotE (MotC chaperone)
MIVSAIKRVVGPAGRGSVLVIAMLLISSATLRLVTSAGSAMAQDGQLPTSPMPTIASKHPESSEAPADPATAAQTSVGMTADRGELSALITALTAREAIVVERERQIEMRMQALSIADAEIEKRLVTLVETENSLRSTLSLADEASEKDILRLTSVYESMKAKDAAALFEEMEPNFAAGFLGRMRPDAAAAVLAGMSPQVAYSVSVILAGRNANVPKT